MKRGLSLPLKTQDGIIFLLLFASLAIPIIQPLGMPLKLSESSKKYYDFIENLNPGSVVVWDSSIGLSIWYNTGPGEIATFQHILKQVREKGVKFIALSTSSTAEGAAIIRRILTEYADTSGLQYGVDYVDLGWIPGVEATEAGIVKDFQSTIKTDYKGTPIRELPIVRDIRGAGDIDVLGFSCGGTIDTWMRQWAPTKIPIITNQLALTMPLNMPYVDKGMITAYIADQRGAAEYENLLGMKGMATSFIDTQNMVHIYAIAIVVVTSLWSVTKLKSKVA